MFDLRSELNSIILLMFPLSQKIHLPEVFAFFVSILLTHTIN